MRPEDRAAARRSLDKRLNILRDSEALSRPPRGWIRAIREALGMTATQLAERLGVVQSRVTAIEHAEAKQTLTLASLEKAAHALDCRLVYALVPRKPLVERVEDRAHLKARKRLESTRHSMALEAQGVDEAGEQEQLKRMVQRLLDNAGSELWKDEK